VFGVDAAFERVTVRVNEFSRRERQNLAQALAGGDADLALHQIDAGYHFRDWMFHLNARIYLDEK